MATNYFLAPLCDLLMENEETGSEENSTKTPGTNGSPGKIHRFHIVMTPEVNLAFREN
jgi:hypothetical protein